jgi:muramoyltetrapeptide carboxypeptidase
MLTHWRLCGALQQLAGIGFGRFSGCDDDEEPIAPDQGWRTVLQERTADLGIPVIADLPVGHEPGNAALAIGQRVRLDASRGELVVLQA